MTADIKSVCRHFLLCCSFYFYVQSHMFAVLRKDKFTTAKKMLCNTELYIKEKALSEENPKDKAIFVFLYH